MDRLKKAFVTGVVETIDGVFFGACIAIGMLGVNILAAHFHLIGV